MALHTEGKTPKRQNCAKMFLRNRDKAMGATHTLCGLPIVVSATIIQKLGFWLFGASQYVTLDPSDLVKTASRCSLEARGEARQFWRNLSLNRLMLDFGIQLSS
jgi:hypothetical protein